MTNNAEPPVTPHKFPLYTLLNFNPFRDACHGRAYDAGWWDRSERYDAYVREPDRVLIPTKLALIHSEISEAFVGYLGHTHDEHLPHLLNAPVELADTLIRIGDLAGYCNLDMSAAIALVQQADHLELWFGKFGPHSQNMSRATTVFAYMHVYCSGAMEGYRKDTADKIIPSISAFVANLARVVILCDELAKVNRWDLPAIAQEKAAYNAVRPDHKAEVRAAEHGKKF